MKLSKKDLRPVQGPSETAPSLHKCCSTEAARAVAERNEWTFDGNDHVCDKNGQRICDSVEALAEKLTQARFITTNDGGVSWFPNWTEMDRYSDFVGTVRSK